MLVTTKTMQCTHFTLIKIVISLTEKSSHLQLLFLFLQYGRSRNHSLRNPRTSGSLSPKKIYF